VADYKLIGKDVAPNDLVAKITGRAKYAEDYRAEGMLFAKILASPMPHARVRSIDAGEALRMPGVVAVLTADEVPAAEWPLERPLTDEPLYEGEPILAVAAVDEATAAEAIERIRVDLEPLPFVLNPLDSLRPDGPDATLQGNCYIERDVGRIKWTKADFDAVGPDELPRGEAGDEWTVGDLEAGFAAADLVIEETLYHQSQTHHPMEPRSSLAYWQNGKLYLHCSTQSVSQARRGMADRLGLALEDVVLIGEYCGGGFGSKIRGSTVDLIAPLLARKTGRPVMLRLTRAEETTVGRARPGLLGWARMGFRSDGRMTALDLYLVQDNGPYGKQGDLATSGEVASAAYTPESMRLRGISVLTNTPPKSAQRGPGGVQPIAMLEPMVDRAARRLGIDRLAIRRVNAADHDSRFGRQQNALTSAYVREAIDLGGEVFGWAEKARLSGRRNGSLVRGVGVAISPYTAGSSGFDGLLLLRPDGRLYIHQGIGNLGSNSVIDTARMAAEVLDMPWESCEVVFGNTAKHLPWSSSQSGSQTTHAHTRTNFVAAHDMKRKLQEIAARDLGGAPGDYEVGGNRVYRRGSPGSGMTLARAAARAIELGGRFDGHELPEDIHEMTAASARALAGSGLIGVAKDTLPHEGRTYSWVIGFAEVDVDVETGTIHLLDAAAVADCGTVLNPRNLAAQTQAGFLQGLGIAHSQKWAIDPQWGVNLTKRMYTAKPPSILDVPAKVRFAAVDKPDPYNPIGAKGIGEPPVGAGAAALVCAVEDALGGLQPTHLPLTPDKILSIVENGCLPCGRLEIHV
jgi:xanthine dehydrogenase molybdenum-binding subunit